MAVRSSDEVKPVLPFCEMPAVVRKRGAENFQGNIACCLVLVATNALAEQAIR
jgi:hypothetical protein